MRDIAPLTAIGIALLLVVSPVATGAVAGASPAPESGEEKYIITFVDDTAREAFTVPSGVQVVGGQNITFTPVLFLAGDTSVIQGLESREAVVSVTADKNITREQPKTSTATQGGTVQSQRASWGAQRIGAQTAAQRVEDGAAEDVNIAVLDSGVAYNHPDLSDVEWGASTSGPTQYGLQAARDRASHGTMVTGVISADDNQIGTVGVAPRADIYAVRVFDANMRASTIDVIRAVDVALKGPDRKLGTDDDADVITFSGGSIRQPFQRERQTWSRASKYAVTIASAGNDGDDDPRTNEVAYPAKYDSVIAVGATDRSDDTVGFSSEGEQVELSAPGARVATTHPNGYSRFSGTSAAAPHVAGVAGLIIAKDLEDGQRDLSPREVRELLVITAKDIESPGKDRLSGYGRVQADRVVPENYYPIVNVTGPQSVQGGESVQLSVNRRNDVDGTVTSTGWQQQAGPSGSLQPSGNTATFTAPMVSQAQNVTVQYRVTDDDGGTRNDTVTMTVKPVSTRTKYDLDGDGAVGRQDILEIIQRYNAGGSINGNPVTATTVSEAISIYNR